MTEEICKICGKQITVQINKGTEVCSENCKKVANGEDRA